MTRFTVLYALAFTSLALAAGKDDAQKKADEAMVKSCQLAKDSIKKHAIVCVGEQAKMGALDCADKEARKYVDFVKLNDECSARVAKNQPKPPPPKDDPRENELKKGPLKANETTCRAVDPIGAPMVAVTVEGSAGKCAAVLGAKVKEKCAEAEAGRKKEYEQIVTTAEGGELKEKTAITCPKAKPKKK